MNKTIDQAIKTVDGDLEDRIRKEFNTALNAIRDLKLHAQLALDFAEELGDKKFINTCKKLNDEAKRVKMP